jgi:hypothetical protein
MLPSATSLAKSFIDISIEPSTFLIFISFSRPAVAGLW